MSIKDPFFEIFSEPLYFNNSEIKRYNTIHTVNMNKKEFLGIKKNYDVVFLNKTIFDISQKVIADFCDMNIAQTNLEWYYLNEDKNAYSGMFSGLLLSEYFEKEYKKYSSNQLFNNSLMDFLRSQIFSSKNKVNFEERQWLNFIENKLNNIYISIVFFNGYDLQYTPSLYFVLSSKRDISSINSLAVDRFGSNVMRKYSKSNNGSVINPSNIYSNEIIDDCIKSFRTKLFDFIREFFLRYLMPLNIKFFKPIIIDINDLNIKQQSLSIDDNLKNKLFELNNRIDLYTHNNKIMSYADITDFIIHERPIDKKIIKLPNSWNKITDTITVNKNYSVSCNRFKKLYHDNNERNNYETACMEDFQKIHKSYL